jgi:hypothetical protein
MRSILANRLRTAETPDLAAQGQSVSRKTGAEVPLNGLSRAVRDRDPSLTPCCQAVVSGGERIIETLASLWQTTGRCFIRNESHFQS